MKLLGEIGDALVAGLYFAALCAPTIILAAAAVRLALR